MPTEDGTVARVTISVGVSVTNPPGLTLPDLLAGADACLYRAKDAGRDQVRLLAGPDRRAHPTSPSKGNAPRR